MSDLGALLFIAMRHIRVRFRQSLVAVLAVAMGAMILVVTLAMMEGLLVEFREKLLEASPPVLVEGEPVKGPVGLAPSPAGGLLSLVKGSPPRDREDIPRYAELEALIRSVDGVKEVAPRACTAIIIYHGTRSERSLCCGIEAGAEKRVTRLWKWMREGRMDDLGESSGGVILGDILARRLAARVGSQLRLVSPAGVAADFRVIGVFASGITKIDDSQSFVRIGEARRIAGLGGGSVTTIGIGVDRLDQVERIAREITRKSGYEALTWEEANKSAIGAFRMMGVSTYLLVIFTAVVGGFGILNIMITVVMEKVKDIAVLRSMGYTASQVLRTFFIEALILGAMGGSMGCVAGYLVSVLIMMIPYQSSDASALQRDEFTMLLEPSFFVTAFIISLGISLLAGVGPARRAARVDPVEVLRGER